MKKYQKTTTQNTGENSLCNHLYIALNGLLDGLDANRDGYNGHEGVGISEKEWQKRIHIANKAIEQYEKEV